MAFNATKTIVSLLGMVAIWLVSTAVLSFFGISFATYGNYLFWAMALVIFSYVLQPTGPSLFIASHESD
tara:strand:+ start:10406 stop:10612 length:207 start_codon:yes stop_codon:yes gene_type:complete